MRRGRLVTAALIVASWGAMQVPALRAGVARPGAADLTAKPIPADLRTAVERASRAGRIIFDHDQAGSIGTGVLLENIEPQEYERRLGGFLALPDVDPAGAPQPSFTVFFVGPGDDPRVVYRVRVPAKAGARSTFERVAPPAPLAEIARRMIRARQTAIARMPPATQPMNPVVVPAHAVTGEDGILVYFLAGTKQPKVAVFGRHYRVLVSADGRTVKRFEPLSKGALELPLSTPRPGTETAYLTVTHDVTDTPLETHVFASLLHRVPVYVVTRRGTWRVDGAQITFLGGPALTRDGRPAPGVALPACADICASVLAARCPRGPLNQADCTVPCEQFRSGSCARPFRALFDCAGAAPRFACDAHGTVTATGCEAPFGELLSCLARQR
jgi:hypothetical protein